MLRDQLEEFFDAALGEPAFAHLAPELAFRRLSAGLPSGRLSGLLLPIKDLTPVAGMPCSYGSASRVVWQESDPIVLELERQGAVIVGKTATSELGMTAYTEPVGLPAPSWQGHTPGGSSGGAAVAVASGLVRIAHGSDGGGSLRVPAAACGVVGYKPPHNSAGGKLTAQGFISRTVADQAFIHDLPLAPLGRPLRVGVLLTPLHGSGSVSPAWRSAAIAAADALSDLGHSVVEVAPAYGPEPFEAFSDVLAGMCRRITGSASPIVSWLRARGLALPEARHAEALAVFESVPAQVLHAWPFDVLLTPTLAFDPPSVGYFSSLAPADDFAEQTRWTPWATLCNITGWAGISIPFGGRSVHLSALRSSPAELLTLAAELGA
ncbi:amidase [Corynebacterium epidermidicanis]|uniref:amidase n=1 Tax=Corynebacterium epidermidicanis TaxID=1050174 RepID=A0A0G3GZE6_9CORY|nr:amidase [Corynebacterium epidermidicanis]AKK04177.1 amidase, Asp-tRNAAsn/Glu-tRNAGln amidotransferase A subunit [Corynebacterium epidermidicanis]